MYPMKRICEPREVAAVGSSQRRQHWARAPVGLQLSRLQPSISAFLGGGPVGSRSLIGCSGCTALGKC
jgi:hypothetical protein